MLWIRWSDGYRVREREREREKEKEKEKEKEREREKEKEKEKEKERERERKGKRQGGPSQRSFIESLEANDELSPGRTTGRSLR